MKKFMISFAVLAVSATAIIAINANNRMDEQFEGNVEALAEGEIIVGELCMVAPGYACTSLGVVYEEHYKA